MMVAEPIYAWPTGTLEVEPAVAQETAPSGAHAWVLAEPVQGYPAGAQVILPRHSILMSAGGPANAARSALVTIGTSVARVCEIPEDRLDDWGRERSGWLHHECHNWMSAAVDAKEASSSAAPESQNITSTPSSLTTPSFAFSAPDRVTSLARPGETMPPASSSPLAQTAQAPEVNAEGRGSLLSKVTLQIPSRKTKTVRSRSAHDTIRGSSKRQAKATTLVQMYEDSGTSDEEDCVSPSLMKENFLKAVTPVQKSDPAFPLRKDRTDEIVQELSAAELDVSPAASSVLSTWRPDARSYQPRADFLQTIITPSTTLSRYSAALVAEVMHAMHAERCSVFFVDEIRKELWCVGSLDMESFSMPLERGIVGCAARSGDILNIGDVKSHPAFDSTVQTLTGYEVRTMLCLPIKHMVDEKRTIGVIQVLNKLGKRKNARFSDQDALDLSKIRELIADSFQRQRWKALESGPSRGDREVLSMIADYTEEEGREQPASISHNASAALHICSGVADDRTSDPSKPMDNLHWLETALRSLTFSALDHSPEELIQLVPIMMQHTGCVDNCAIPLDTLNKWSRAARQQYRDNPFHSWFHAFSAFQFCYYQLYTSNVSTHLRFLDVFALLIAALCHDLEHPGFTNNYLVDSQSELALRYNDISVLENHHAALACDLLRGESTRIAAGLDAASQKALRRCVIRCILDTDMTHHSSICQKIVALKPEDASEQDRELLLSACIHTSDLSAQTQSWDLASRWEERISQEFAHQASAERAAGREPAPFMQFRLDDLKQRGKLQRDFIDFVLVPLWEPYTCLLPEIRQCYENLVHNRALYDYRAVNGKDEKDAAD